MEAKDNAGAVLKAPAPFDHLGDILLSQQMLPVLGAGLVARHAVNLLDPTW